MSSNSTAACQNTTMEYSNIDATEFPKTVIDFEKPKLFLHACCGPCASACIERLAPNYSITAFYYNPNIMDKEEYFLRRESLRKFIREFNEENADKYFVDYNEGNYDPQVFIDRTWELKEEPEGGARCTVCFDIRLEETARIAKELDMDYFTTTLTISPHKNYDIISSIGKSIGKKRGINYLAEDFKKRGGFQRSIELSKKHGLYRQNFCGCEYARRMQKAKKI